MDPSSRTTFALSVSQVSCYWHETAMQTPLLWSGINIRSRRTGAGCHNLLQILLQRSHPLDITLTLCRDGDLFSSMRILDRHELFGKMSMLIPNVSRWRTFSCDCEELYEVSLVWKLLANLSAPTLESFNLVLSHPVFGDQSCDIFTGGAPNLLHVSIGGFHPRMCLPPLSSITILHLLKGFRLVPGEGLIKMLRASQNLMSLYLDGAVAP
jgi:hypothetical protein